MVEIYSDYRRYLGIASMDMAREHVNMFSEDLVGGFYCYKREQI